MSLREPTQVARRAIILTTIAFRGSLETMRQFRAVELSVELLPWLREIGIDDELDPIERAELETACGRLSPAQRLDTRVAGEAASFLIWTLNRGERPAPWQFTDGMPWITKLAVERAEFLTLLDSPTFRDHAEIEAACREIAAIRTAFLAARESAGPPGLAVAKKDVVVRTQRDKWAALGLSLSDDDLQRGAEAVAALPADQRKAMGGLYFVRELAATWLYDRRPTYFNAEAAATELSE